MDAPKYKYLFGPVPSRRLGRSLGVDIVPMKTCTQNCIYCQLGKDAPQTLDRTEYAPIDAVLGELKAKIAAGLEADFVTLSGSGEPTLHRGLGTLIDGIHTLTDIPVAVITNGTLLFRPDVRDDCCKADVVLPSLDAGDAATFEKINHPHNELDFQTYAEGLVAFRTAYTGHLWLEVFLCEGVNTSESALANLKTWIEKICPDKIQVNTAVRPVVHPEAAKVERTRLHQLAHFLSPQAEVIADFNKYTAGHGRTVNAQIVLETLRRRPCSLQDLHDGLGLGKEELHRVLDSLESAGQIVAERRGHENFYKTP
jgi:wyosine [tRNA(Phe)-imidazoG37] synthetase (radical SAM superfamily)